MGVVASSGLVLYFVGANASHLRVGDLKDIGPAPFMLAVASALAMRILTQKPALPARSVPRESQKSHNKDERSV
jgi:hypothetical protein